MKGLFQRLDESDDLVAFIDDNILEFIDFPNLPYGRIVEAKDTIDKFITDKSELLWELNYELENNRTFILSVYDICVRFGLLNTISIAQIVYKCDISLSSRLLAANLYLLHIASSKDLVDRFPKICEHLQIAFDSGEDDSFKINITFANYLIYVIRNTQSPHKQRLNGVFREYVAIGSFQFISSSKFIIALSEIELVDERSEVTINRVIDAYILNLFKSPSFNPDFLVESATDYKAILEKTPFVFQQIRQISVKKYTEIKEDAIFRSLTHGEGVLLDERQLYAYMNSYGSMHYHKLMSAFNKLPDLVFDKEVSIIDWGCGQGLATIVYFEFLKVNGLKNNVKQVTLIEPSELALRRASLHAKHADHNLRIFTINKDLDSLSVEDLALSAGSINLHLFSNILDMEKFQMTELVSKIEVAFEGLNYFVCVSPNITELRTNRLNAFASHFQKKFEFEMLASFTNLAHDWMGSWTRVVRLFVCDIIVGAR